VRRFQVKLLGEPMPAPWDLSLWETHGDDWEFDSAQTLPDGSHPNVRRVVMDLVE
jgi:hypothetical protein